MSDEFNEEPDPYGIWQSWADVEYKEPGALLGLYSAVLSACRHGKSEDVPLEAIQLLLEKMGPPNSDPKKRDKLSTLRSIEAIQLFSTVGIPNGKKISFRQAWLMYYEYLQETDSKNLNSFEKQLKVKNTDEAYKQLQDLRGRRIIE